MKQITTILLAGTAALFLSACGGGSSSDSTSAPTPPPSTGPEVIETGSSFIGDFPPYDIKGDEFYYELDNCSTDSLFNRYVEYEIYSDNTMQVSYIKSDNNVVEMCDITKKFVPQEASDGPIDAIYMDYWYFYEDATKLYYTISRGSAGYGKLIEVIDYGNHAILKVRDSGENREVSLVSVVEEVPLD